MFKIKRFNQKTNESNLNESDFESYLSEYLDKYEKDIEKIEKFNLICLKRAKSLSWIQGVPERYNVIDETYFTDLKEIVINRNNLFFTDSKVYIDSSWSSKYNFGLINYLEENFTSNNKIVSYPITRVTLDDTSNYVLYKKSNEIQQEYKDLIESFKSLYNQTGLRPFGHFWTEEYYDDSTEDEPYIFYHIIRIGELLFIDCDDDEYKKLYACLIRRNTLMDYRDDNESLELFKLI
jgi:hypothetical protein